jgi:hypothetical protein
MLHDVVYRLRAFFSRPGVEDELQEELQYHLEREAEKYRKAGMEPEEDMRRARLALGIQVTLVGLLLGFAGALVAYARTGLVAFRRECSGSDYIWSGARAVVAGYDRGLFDPRETSCERRSHARSAI